MNQNPVPYARRAYLGNILPWLMLAAALSVSMMVLGAGRADKVLPSFAAGLLAALLIGTGLGINAPLWSKLTEANCRGSLKAALTCNIWLSVVLYAWGALALFGMYSLSDLTWQHSHQYATGAALFAAGIAAYAVRLGTDKVPPVYLTVVHGLAAFFGLTFLIASGKLGTLRADWAANIVFLAGGCSMVALCAMSALTQILGERAAVKLQSTS